MPEQSSESEAQSTETGTETESKTFSQDQVNSFLAEEKRKLTARYADYDDIKVKASKYDEYENGMKTPDEKALEDAKNEAAGEVTQKFLRRLVTTETKGIARDLGFIDPDDALRVIGDELPVKGDEPDTDSIRKAVEKLASEKPHLVESRKRAPRERPKPTPGEKTGDETTAGKGKAAAALRQLGATRKGS